MKTTKREKRILTTYILLRFAETSCDFWRVIRSEYPLASGVFVR
jgi:hypothetical protein